MEKITFSFGENWLSLVSKVNKKRIEYAIFDIKKWLSDIEFKDKTILDIGCGSGIHSLAFYLIGAKEIVSFDYDIRSFSATQILWNKFNKPENWKIMQGSILDNEFIKKLGKFDIVYAWGVLHHTGNLFKSLENTLSLVKDEGILWIAIYTKGPNYQKHLELKIKYNKASKIG